jgi:hypothetical protein
LRAASTSPPNRVSGAAGTAGAPGALSASCCSNLTVRLVEVDMLPTRARTSVAPPCATPEEKMFQANLPSCGLSRLKVAWAVTSAVLPSAKVPMTV